MKMSAWVSMSLLLGAMGGCASMQQMRGEGILPPPPASGINSGFVLPADASADVARVLDDSVAEDTLGVEPPLPPAQKTGVSFFYDPKAPKTPPKKPQEPDAMRMYEDTTWHAIGDGVDTALVRASWGSIRRHLATGEHLALRSAVWPGTLVVEPRSGRRVIEVTTNWLPLSRFSSEELRCASRAGRVRVVSELTMDDSLPLVSTLRSQGEFQGVDPSSCQIRTDWINRVGGVAFDVWMGLDRAAKDQKDLGSF